MAGLGFLTAPLNLVPPPLCLGGATWSLYRGSQPLSSDVVILCIFSSKLSILLIILPIDFGVRRAPSPPCKCHTSGSHIPTSFSGCHCIWDILNRVSPFLPVPSVSKPLFITGFSTSVIRVSLISLNIFTLITCVSNTGGSIAFIAIYLLFIYYFIYLFSHTYMYFCYSIIFLIHVMSHSLHVHNGCHLSISCSSQEVMTTRYHIL